MLSVSGRGAVPAVRFSLPLLDILLPRASIFEDKRCEESLCLEKLAVGRNGLLPLRGTANSPSTCV